MVVGDFVFAVVFALAFEDYEDFVGVLMEMPVKNIAWFEEAFGDGFEVGAGYVFWFD